MVYETKNLFRIEDHMNQYLSGKEVAEKLGVSSAVITRLSNRGELQYEVVGKRKIYPAKSVKQYLVDNNLCEAPSDHKRRLNNKPKISALSFFSGAGGLDLGLENVGVTNLLHCENNREARMTIQSNRPEAALIGDISNTTAGQILEFAGLDTDDEVDIMHGGPPCQAFSTAGSRRAFNDPRGNVFLRYLELAAEIRPKYLVIENVRGLLSTPYPLRRGENAVSGGALTLILRNLENMGYGVSFNLYNSANFGAAQTRERVILIAKRDGSVMPWLKPTNSNDESWGLPRWKTFGDVCNDLDVIEHHFSQFPEKRLKYFRKLKEGEYWTSLSTEDQKEALGKAYFLGGGKTGFYRRITRSKPSPTLVTSPTMPATDLCHPIELRPLSIEEYKALQGFPSDWNVAGSINDQYRQLGNAVPVPLGEAIGKAIIADMSGNKSDEYINFPYSRYKNTSHLSWGYNNLRMCEEKLF
ncbi:DNA cytosine methyltransferase [Rothia aerolata]|uniref:DNA (cytosine-5-)-methyltransferase n=1 Tax=Rothia aerolata TaxID=1812262 RepID=A0A917MTY5_9MICC|nr:DNA cytosine methyltransferase [Rothia aerolata]GGH63956.1 cytosine-specific methyltransferase [Rothia aerolata]